MSHGQEEEQVDGAVGEPSLEMCQVWDGLSVRAIYHVHVRLIFIVWTCNGDKSVNKYRCYATSMT